MSTAAAEQHPLNTQGHERYHRSDYLFDQSGITLGENGLLQNVVVCRVGPAKGYGTNLDQSFIEQVVNLGNEFSQGLKCRFGHPNMSTTSLGTFLGRMKNFHVDGDKARADIQLDEISKKAPGGNLYDYIAEMAAKNQDMFGMSIVFQPGKYYFYDDQGNKVEGYPQDDRPVYESIKELFACDCVDDPAATDSLFSKKFNSEQFAVQMTEFLDEHDEIFQLMIDQPAAVEKFLARYHEYRKLKNPAAMTEKKTIALSAKAKAALLKLGRKLDVTAGTTSGETIHIITAGSEPAVGDQVNVVNADGSEAPAPDNTYVINEGEYDGWTCVVADGVITEISTPETIAPDTTPSNTVQNESAAKVTALEQEITALKSKNDELAKKLSDTPAAAETIVAEAGDENFMESDESKLADWNKQGLQVFNKFKEAAADIKEEAA